MEEPTIKKFLGENIIYDKGSQMIFAVRNDGHNQLIVDVRGWGSIQHLFQKKSGLIDMDKAQAFQDELGQFVTDAIKEKLKKTF